MGKTGSPRCTVCLSTHAARIDAALLAGRSASSLAAEYSLGVSSIQRHRRYCLPKRLAEAAEVTEVHALTGEQLLAQVTEVQRRAVELADHAETAGDIKERAQSLRELRATVELLSKLSFAIADRPAKQLDGERPDIDALIVDHLTNVDQSGGVSMPMLTAGTDEDVVEATLVD